MRGPPLERGATLVEIKGLIVDATNPALVATNVAQERLYDMRRHVEAIVQGGRYRAPEVVQAPGCHRGTELGVELFFRLGEAGERAFAVAKNQIPIGPMLQPGRKDGARGR
jgi:hypothetical protein